MSRPRFSGRPYEMSIHLPPSYFPPPTANDFSALAHVPSTCADAVPRGLIGRPSWASASAVSRVIVAVVPITARVMRVLLCGRWPPAVVDSTPDSGTSASERWGIGGFAGRTARVRVVVFRRAPLL